jgi:hypothetical protein
VPTALGPSRPTTVAASYERVSTRVQDQTGFSLAAQHESNDAFAESRGWVTRHTGRRAA